MSALTQAVELPLWAAFLVLFMVGGCSFLRGYLVGKGIKL